MLHCVELTLFWYFIGVVVSLLLIILVTFVEGGKVTIEDLGLSWCSWLTVVFSLCFLFKTAIIGFAALLEVILRVTRIEDLLLFLENNSNKVVFDFRRKK